MLTDIIREGTTIWVAGVAIFSGLTTQMIILPPRSEIRNRLLTAACVLCLVISLGLLLASLVMRLR